jgi:lipid-binding SYLF domain-containing protein
MPDNQPRAFVPEPTPFPQTNLYIMLTLSLRNTIAMLALSIATVLGTNAHAESREALERSSRTALNTLIAQNATARELSTKAAAVLVFPSVKKAGLMIGGQYGEGVLWRGDKATAFYNTGGASFGFQAGAQEYGYALFFMKEDAVKALDLAQGFEVGVGPSIVVIDQGMGNSTTTTTMQKDIYAFIFSQKGLMAGIGIQGNKITKINK